MDAVGLATLISVIVAAIGGSWYLRSRFSKLETRFNQVINSVNNLNSLISTIISRLREREILTEKDNAEIQAAYSAALNVQEISSNPLGEHELAELNEYIRRAKAGGSFTEEEVREYNNLVSQLKSERGDDPSIWPLLALGAFLLGLYLGTRQ